MHVESLDITLSFTEFADNVVISSTKRSIYNRWNAW